MKKHLSIWLLFLTLLGVSAQPSSIRLAVVAIQSENQAAADILTTVLSQNEMFALMERNEIDRILREQNLAATGRDPVKLGELLGADGVLFLETAREKTNRFLRAQLVATKPGVIVGDFFSDFAQGNALEWAEQVAKHFEPLYPKLRVLKKDAIPISVVNLRASVESKEQKDLERQLTLLLIARLSHERDIFVLERRRLSALEDEKALKEMAQSPFWNGSYLLEGTLDRDGVSREKFTLDVQMKPPGAAAGINIALSGPRTNLNRVVEELTQKILNSLERSAATNTWDAQAEAQKYFEEARWFLKWNVAKEAQAASEAAWALGKRDQESALVKVQSLLALVPIQYARQTRGSGTYLSETSAQQAAQQARARHPEGLAISLNKGQVTTTVFEKPPRNSELIPLRRAMEFYLNFNKTLATDDAKTNALWLEAGLKTVQAASIVLQQQYFFPRLRQSYTDDLAEVRLLTRKMAEAISSLPSVHASYWTGDRVVTYDELSGKFDPGTSIFNLKVKFGSFWQETPEECIALYRELLGSAVFGYIHKDFWMRSIELPRVVAWRSADASRMGVVWNNFVRELEASTNFLWRTEAAALKVADAPTPELKLAEYERLVSRIFSEENLWISHPVDLLYLSWRLDALLVNGTGVVSAAKERMQQKYYKEDRPKFEEMWSRWKTARQGNGPSLPSPRKEYTFEDQKAWLSNNTPFDSLTFTRTFSYRAYTKEQAAELHPLVATYLSNLNAQATKPSAAQAHLGSLEKRLARVLDPTLSVPVAAHPRVPSIDPKSPVLPNFRNQGRAFNPAPPAAATPEPAPITGQKLAVSRFVSFPVEKLVPYEVTGFQLSRPSLRQGKLLFDFWFSYQVVEYTASRTTYHTIDHHGSAFFDPVSETWQIIGQPKAVAKINLGPSTYRMEPLINSELHDQSLYSSFKNELRRYDLKTQRWELLPLPGEKQLRLFSVNSRLFGVNEEAIMEILDHGKSNRLLASTRRRPTASILDQLESLGKPVVFSGPSNVVHAVVQGKIYSEAGNDWIPISINSYSFPPDIFEGDIILRRYALNRSLELFRLNNNRSEPELLWRDNAEIQGLARQSPVRVSEPMSHSNPPRWRGNLTLPPNAPLTLLDGDLFLLQPAFISNPKPTPTSTPDAVQLICLLQGKSTPVLLPLDFSASPATGAATTLPSMVFLKENSAWMQFTENALVFALGKKVMNDQQKPGFWMLPRTDLVQAIPAEKGLK